MELGLAERRRALARRIDHSLLYPALSLRDFEAGCDLAVELETKTVCVRSADVAAAQRRVEGSPVLVCAVVGFPHGNVPTCVKCFEAETALGEGARELDMVVDVPRVLRGDYASVARDIASVAEVCRKASAKLKVIFECAYLDRGQKLKLCELARSEAVAFVKTSTGFALPSAGREQALGATVEDVALLSGAVAPVCGVKAAGGIRELAQVERLLAAGATRIGTSSTRQLLEAVE